MTRRERLRQIIFEADTPAGKAFDVGLMVAILCSVLAVMLESVASVRESAGPALAAIEWVITVLFTVEYVARLWVVERPLRYARSFFGVVDLLAVLPSYLSLVVPGAHGLAVVRSLRLLRIFRVFKLGRFLGEQNLLMTSLRLEPREDPRVPGHGPDPRSDPGHRHVRDRGRGLGVHQHSRRDVLGDRHPDDGRLRRHRADHAARPGARRRW